MRETQTNLISTKRKEKITHKPFKANEEATFKPNLASKEEKLIRFLEDKVIPPYMDTKVSHHSWNMWFHSDDPLRPTRILKVNDVNKTVCEYGKESLMGEVNEAFRRFARMDDHPSGKYCLSSKEIVGFTQKLMYSGRRLATWPKAIGFKSDKDYCFQRFNFDPAETATPADFPTINLNLQHMNNSRNFCERVGSLYDPAADRKQILFLIGEGDGGKSALINLLTFLAGGPEGIASVGMSVYKDFGFDPLLDKRVWIAEEIEPEFPEHPRFKNLTGGSAVQINRKGEKQFNAYFTGILFATANEPPKVKNDSGLKNRILICEIDPVPKELRLPPAETSARMRAELPHFIRYCLDAYSRVSGDGTLVPDNTDKLDSIIAEDQMDTAAVFSEYLQEDLTVLGKNALLTPVEYHQVWELICEENKAFAKAVSRKKFNEYVKGILCRKEIAVRCHGHQGRMIPGLRLKKRETRYL